MPHHVRTSRAPKRALLALTAAAIAGGTLVASPATATHPGVNGRIFFEQGKNIVAVDPDGTDREVVIRSAWFNAKPELDEPSASPDGNKIAFVVSSTDVWTVDLATSKVKNLTEKVRRDKGLSDLRYPTWSPNGKTLLFQALHKKDGTWIASIYRINYDKTGFKRLRTLPGFWGVQQSTPDWGTNGKIAFMLQNDVYTMDPSGGTLKKLTDCGCYARISWSPDATKIATEGAVDGDVFESGSGIVVIHGTTGAVLTAVTGNANVDERYVNPSWSPDGTQIVFQGYQKADTDGGMRTDDLYVVAAQQGAQTTKLEMSNIFDDIPAQFPDWSTSPVIP